MEGRTIESFEFNHIAGYTTTNSKRKDIAEFHNLVSAFSGAAVTRCLVKFFLCQKHFVLGSLLLEELGLLFDFVELSCLLNALLDFLSPKKLSSLK